MLQQARTLVDSQDRFYRRNASKLTSTAGLNEFFLHHSYMINNIKSINTELPNLCSGTQQIRFAIVIEMGFKFNLFICRGQLCLESHVTIVSFLFFLAQYIELWFLCIEVRFICQWFQLNPPQASMQSFSCELNDLDSLQVGHALCLADGNHVRFRRLTVQKRIYSLENSDHLLNLVVLVKLLLTILFHIVPES